VAAALCLSAAPAFAGAPVPGLEQRGAAVAAYGPGQPGAAAAAYGLEQRGAVVAAYGPGQPGASAAAYGLEQRGAAVAAYRPGQPGVTGADDALAYRGAPGEERSPVEELLPPYVAPRFTARFNGGVFRPSGDAVQLVYADPAWRFGLSGGYYLIPDLALSLGGGYAHLSGTAVGRNSHRASQDASELLLVPLELGLTYELSRLPLPYLKPYLAVGIDGVYFRETVTDSSVSGMKWGAHARLGLAYRIDDGPVRTWTSDANRGIRGTSITFEGGYTSASNFGASGNDLGGVVLLGGLSLDF
jgi:hypothetical protein